MTGIALLGAPDPEMTLVEELLLASGWGVEHALDVEEKPVNPRTAYQTHGRTLEHNGPIDLAIECAGPYVDGGTIDRIDHHRPGDPGFGKPPTEFMAGSSLGQLILYLASRGELPESWEWWPSGGMYSVRVWHEPHGEGQWYVSHPSTRDQQDGWDYVAACVPRRYVVAAAADHCLAAAYAGQCPGVTRGEVLEWRAACAVVRSQHAAAQGWGRQVVTWAGFMADIESATGALWLARTCEGFPGRVCDLRSRGHVAELPDAASYLGVAYLQSVEDRDGRKKLVIGGAASPEQVGYFKGPFAAAEGLTGVYGDPARGFAGGYLP